MAVATGVEIEASTPDNDYEISEERWQYVQRLTKELLEDRPPVGDERFVCYKINNQDRYASIGRYIESAVFQQSFNNDAELMKQEYGPYEDQSIFYLSVDKEEGVPTGVLRIIQNGDAGLKTLNDLVEKGQAASVEEVARRRRIDSLDNCWDVGTVAVLDQYRAKVGPSIQLYRAMYLDAVDMGIDHIVSIIDARAYHKLVDYLGVPFQPLLQNDEPFEYLDSKESHAVYGYVPEFYKKMNRKRYTVRGFLARKALSQLVRGSRDEGIQFDSNYDK